MAGVSNPRSVAFRQRREADWLELEGIVEKVLAGGLSSLAAGELEQLPRLYRTLLASLSVARKTALDRALLQYLEALAGRAYLAVYGTRRTRKGAFWATVFVGFPQRVRAIGWELLTAFLITALGVIVAMALVDMDSGWYSAFVDPSLSAGRNPSATTEFLRSALYDGADASTKSLFASMLFAHNSRVAMTAFALGFVAGVPTALLLFSNGLMLGAFLQLYASRGLLYPLLGWLLPHGIPEIGAVILCGAAGLHLGRAVVLPGRQTVRQALQRAGQHTAVIVFVSVFLLAIAGLFEGIFRQSVTDDRIRFTVAGLNALWFFGWIFLVGWGRRGARV